jgi:hypothetical protein
VELAGSSARFFYCAMCRGLTAICLRCDRGQRYCSPACALEARRRSMSEANKRYAATLKGGLARAEASRNYRSRMNKVIDQGSPRRPPDGLLAQSPVAAKEPLSPDGLAPPAKPVKAAWYCCRCGRCCPDFFRWDFLRRRAPRSIAHCQNACLVLGSKIRDKRGVHGDHPP